MDKTLAFNEITPLPYCFKVLQTCFGLPEFDTEKGQSSSFVPEPPANFWTTGYIGLSVLKFFFRLIIVGSNLFCLIMIGIHLLKLLYNLALKRRGMWWSNLKLGTLTLSANHDVSSALEVLVTWSNQSWWCHWPLTNSKTTCHLILVPFTEGLCSVPLVCLEDKGSQNTKHW